MIELLIRSSNNFFKKKKTSLGKIKNSSNKFVNIVWNCYKRKPRINCNKTGIQLRDDKYVSHFEQLVIEILKYYFCLFVWSSTYLGHNFPNKEDSFEFWVKLF